MAHTHNPAENKKLLTRIRKIKGQSIALENSLENTPDCVAFLQQIAALKGAVNGLMKEVLESHLREHLGAEDITPEQRGEEVEQVISILKSYMK
ncbi:metal/formaldehyde-sensitive transcriptional repressor [Colwellia sp. RE-S-Sl-9]